MILPIVEDDFDLKERALFEEIPQVGNGWK
jgi:hypothetical protein